MTQMVLFSRRNRNPVTDEQVAELQSRFAEGRKLLDQVEQLSKQVTEAATVAGVHGLGGVGRNGRPAEG